MLLSRRCSNAIRLILIFLFFFSQPGLLRAKANAASLITNCTEAGLDAALASGGDISFNCGGPATITITNGKTISQDTTLDGSNGGSQVVLDGADKAWFFSVPSGVSFTLRHMTLQHAYSTYVYFGDDGFGSAVKNAGNFTADSVRFYQNQAIGGGAIGNSGTLTLINSTFEENHTYYNYIRDSMIRGGAISSSGSALTIQNSTFLRNYTVMSSGGAVSSSDLQVTITGSTFEGNNASGFAWTPANSSIMTIRDSHFRSNSSDAWGGALFAGVTPCDSGTPGCTPNQLIIENTDFVGNKAHSHGGAVNVDRFITLIADYLTFDRNTADGDGGGMNISLNGPQESTITNSVFTNNTASGGGGLAITGLVRAENNTFTGNKAINNGGGASLHADAKLMNNILTGNQVTGDWYNAGGSAVAVGAFNNAGHPVIISGNLMTGNQVLKPYTNGGTIHIWDSTETQITNNTVTNNTNAPGNTATAIFSVGGGFTLTHNTIVYNTGEGPSIYDGYGDNPQIIQGNILVNNTSQECRGADVNKGSNYIRDTSCGTGPNDLIGSDPRLGALMNNGGPTKTYNLYENSPALNAAASDTCPAADQRSVARPVGSGCDMGSLEADSPLPLPPAPAPKPVANHDAFPSMDTPKMDGAIAANMARKGDPVNTIFGNFTYQHLDLTLPGIFPVHMQRTYNSANPEDGLLGFGWNLSFNLSISQPAPDQIIVKRGDGRQDIYAVNATTGAISQPAGSKEILTKAQDGSYTLTTRDQLVYHFKAAGQLETVTDPSGNTVTLTYTNAQWTGIKDAVGRDWVLAYNPAGRLASLTDPSGRVVQYSYDENGNLIQVTNPNSGTTNYQYDANHRITKITDAEGKLIASMQYNAEGRVFLQTDARGVHLYAYEPGQTLYTDPSGLVTKILYDEQYRVTQNVKAWGTKDAIPTETITYDDAGFVATRTDADGNTTSFIHDADGNITQQTDALGKTTTMTYDNRGNLLTVTDPLSRTTTYTYNAGNEILTRTDPTGAVTTYTYDAKGLLTDVKDALDNVTHFTYDDFGNVLEAKDALDHTVTKAYDTAGRVKTITDALGNETGYTYNPLDLMLTQTNPDGGTVTNTYSANGIRLTTADPLNHVTSYAYTTANDLASVTNALNQTTSYIYDLAGHRTSETLPDGSTWTNTFDAFGHLVARTSPLGYTTRYTYDAAGNLLTVTDQVGSTFTYQYDALNRLSKVTDQLGGETVYTYDDASQLVAITDPLQHTTTFTYDDMGRRKTQTDALGHTITYGYDKLGQLTSVQNGAGETVSYTYDVAGHLLSISGPGVNTSFTYDATGRRLTMTDALGKTDYGYDATGRLTSVSGPLGAVAYTYDLAGNRTTMTQPGASLAYNYDELNRLSELATSEQALVQYGYNSLGLTASQSFGSGAVTSMTYDTDSRLTGMNTQLGQDPLMAIAYSLDARGSRLSETTKVRGVDVFRGAYSYDTAGRLVGATLRYTPPNFPAYMPMTRVGAFAPNAALEGGSAAAPTAFDPQILQYAYTYDAAGNRLTAQEGSAASTYTYNEANQISAPGFVYDAAGRLTSDGASTYTYDGLRRITAISGKINAAYVYDGDGNRVRETVNGVQTDYLVDTAARLPVRIAATTGGKVTRSFFGLGPVAQQSPDGSLRYLYSDGLGSIRLVTDATGKITGRAAYAPFGAALFGSSVGAFGFTGEPGSAGLLYLRARDYSPALGRFLTPDPSPVVLKYPDTLNFYSYVRNNPVNFTDPSGLCNDWDFWCKGQETAAAIAAAAQAAAQAAAEAAAAAARAAAEAAATAAQAVVQVVETVVSVAETVVTAVASGAQAVGSWVASGITNSSGLSESSASKDSLGSANGAGVIAMGGGNVIAMGGGNLISDKGLGIVSRDGAGVVSRDMAGIVSRDGAGLTSKPKADVVAMGGGNVIAMGGGN